MRCPPPTPPHPDMVRRPRSPFGWIEDRMLRDGWLACIGVDAVGVLVLLVLAADRRGASFYSRDRMAGAHRAVGRRRSSRLNRRPSGRGVAPSLGNLHELCAHPAS